MYRVGQIRPEVEQFPMDQALRPTVAEVGSCSDAWSSSRTADQGRLSRAQGSGLEDAAVLLTVAAAHSG